MDQIRLALFGLPFRDAHYAARHAAVRASRESHVNSYLLVVADGYLLFRRILMTRFATGPEYYASGTFAIANGYPYIVGMWCLVCSHWLSLVQQFVQVCSCQWADYCLYIYLKANMPALSKIRPMVKFYCLKIIYQVLLYQV